MPPPPQKSLASAPLTLEDQVRLSFFTPAPSSYHPKKGDDVDDPKKHGKISNSVAPSVHDYVPRSKAFVPGPGSYDTHETKGFALPEGGRLNRQPPANRLSQDPLLDEYPIPAPGHYGVPQDPTRPRQAYGKFSRDRRVSKYIVDEERRSRQVPGPGAHEVLDAMENVRPFCPEGGRVMAGVTKPSDYFDAAPKQYVAPGPGQYDLPPGINANRGNAKAIFRYESATIAETKALMTRACGDNNNAPGPGSYDLPEPMPISGVPSIKGRQLPHGMPSPYAYNCAPDYAGKYSRLAPLRQQSSAAQIFGTGMGGSRSGQRASSSISDGDRPALAKQDVDRVHSTRLPNNVGDGDVPDEEAVKWMSGGFAGVRKVKSTSKIRREDEHPMLRAAKGSYPVLGLRGGREHGTFLPNKGRRVDPVCTHDGAKAYKRLVRGQWQVKAIREGLKHASVSVLEPLDLDKLKQDASTAVANKARERMSTDGVSKEKHDLILAEMMGILQEQNLAPQPVPQESTIYPDSVTQEGHESRSEQPWTPVP